jgi:hypothetical protein
LPGHAKTLRFPFNVHKTSLLLVVALLAANLSTQSSAIAQEKEANLSNEENTGEAPQEPVPNRRAKTPRSNSSPDQRLSRLQKQSAISFGTGFYFPLTRPTAALAFSALGRSTELSLRLTGSYTSLSDSFEAAAAGNKTYAQKISGADAYLWDVDLAVPELAILLPANFYVAATSFARYTRCVSDYSTTTGSPLVFSGWGMAVGVGGRGGYRYPISGDKVFLEFYGSLTWPLWSAGSTEVTYTPTDAAASQTFSADDLDTIRDSLQVYLKDLSYQVTTEAGLRAAWRF